MELFDVYPRFDVTPVLGKGCYVYDEAGVEYLDCYGGHAVISVGHAHPSYVEALTSQLKKLSFYSNSVNIPIQDELAHKLGKASGYEDYNLFLCNSGAEANENALKLASFHNGKSKVIAFKNSFHGRTAAALRVTDNVKLAAPINQNSFETVFVELNDLATVENHLKNKDVCAVIIEGIQGVGGLDMPTDDFLKALRAACDEHGALLILDEIQSGFLRTGKFFAHQFSGIKPDIISMAKGMGNGFPVAGILIDPRIKASSGLLGTTFGGNQLACASVLSVLDILEEEHVAANVETQEKWLVNELKDLPRVKKIKGRGLMIGVEFDFPIKDLRTKLLFDHRIFTGSSKDPNVIRVLPPLNIGQADLEKLVTALKQLLG
ncbi:aspartate aminotransferase family protein [Bacteroidota bacterium]